MLANFYRLQSYTCLIMRLAVALGIYIHDGSQIKKSSLIRWSVNNQNQAVKDQERREVIVSDKRSELT